MRRALTRSVFAPRPVGRGVLRISPTPMRCSPPAKWRRNWPAKSCSRPRRGSRVPARRGKRAPQRLDRAAFQRALVEEMESRFTVAARCWAGARPGPGSWRWSGRPGAGKTTTLVKLAVNYGLASRRPVLLLSDGYLPRGGGRAVALVCGHPGSRLPGAGDRRGAGPGHRGEPRQGADLHRHPGLGGGRHGQRRAAWRSFFPREATSTRNWSCRLP